MSSHIASHSSPWPNDPAMACASSCISTLSIDSSSLVWSTSHGSMQMP